MNNTTKINELRFAILDSLNESGYRLTPVMKFHIDVAIMEISKGIAMQPSQN